MKPVNNPIFNYTEFGTIKSQTDELHNTLPTEFQS